MIKDILRFFREEKIYTLIFLVLVVVFGYFLWSPQPRMPEPKTSEALQNFRQAEERMERNFKDADSLKQFLKQQPQLENILKSLVFFIAGAVSLGIVIDFFLLFFPKWRSSFAHPKHSSAVHWKISMIFKAILLIISGSVAVGLILGILSQTLFTGLSENFHILLHTALTDFLCFVFIYYLVRQGGGHLKDLGFRIPRNGILHEIGIGIGGYLAILPLFIGMLVLLIFLAQLFSYNPPPHPLVTVFLEEQARSPFLIGCSLFLGIFAGPFFEEIFFRGFCYPILKKKFGVRMAMIIISAFFALIHQNAFAFWPIFILGMALTYVYEKRSSIIAPVVLHITHNAVFITYFFVAKHLVKASG